jgi:hypothetical protein
MTRNTLFDPYTVTVADAARVRKWIASRGGVLLWESADLSDPGATWLTPAKRESGEPHPPPHWKSKALPLRHITTEAEIVVEYAEVVKKFHVGVRRGSGLTLVLTDGAKRRLATELARAGQGAHYAFDYETQDCVITAPVKSVPLSEWKETE